MQMKRILALFLACVMILSGCTSNGKRTQSQQDTGMNNDPVVTQAPSATDVPESSPTNEASQNNGTVEIPQPLEPVLEGIPVSAESYQPPERVLDFNGLSDPKLLSYVESTVCADVSRTLGNNYRVENVSTLYISKEYIEELTYNSQTNVFFGYSLAELDAQFQGTRYVFTLGENGETTVVPFEAYDDTYERVLKNVAIGTGVILVCVTVSVATGGLGAPAVSMIFAASAKSATIFALSSGAISAVITGTITGIQTEDFHEALKAGALAGSESFKWGVITGAILGGGTELLTSKAAASGGLTLDEAAIIMKESELPANFVKQIHSMEEYYELLALADNGGLTISELSSICMSTGYPLELVKLFHTTEEGMVYFEQAGLYAETINGQAVLVRTIDLTYESELAGKTVTNLERMRQGYAAIDPLTGQAYQLHHIGQSVDSPLAILTQLEHTGGGNNAILHDVNIANGQGVHSLLSDAEWALQREEFWEAFAAFIAG